MYCRVSDFLFPSSPSRAFFHHQCPTCAGKSRQLGPKQTRENQKKKKPSAAAAERVGSDGDETEGNGGGCEGKAPVCSRHQETPEGIVTVLAVPRHGPGGRGRELGGLPHQGGEARREQTLSFRGWAQVRSTGQVQAKGKITYLPTYLTTDLWHCKLFFFFSLIRPKLTPHLSFPLANNVHTQTRSTSWASGARDCRTWPSSPWRGGGWSPGRT